MKWKFFPLILLIALSPLHSFASNPAELNARIEAARREKNSLLEEQRRLQAELDKLNSESRTLGSAVKTLDAAKKKLSSDIRLTQSKIRSTDLTIQTLENNVSDAERAIRSHREAIETAIQGLSQADSRPLVLDFLSSESFSELWRDRSQLESLSATLSLAVDKLRETKTVLTREKEKKERTKKEILSLQRELSVEREIVEESQRAKERLLADTKNREAEYQRMLKENLARQEQFEEDIYRLESELRITLDPSLIPEKRPGVLSWPLDTVYITQRFGRTAGSARLYASGTHNGVDFRASQGTQVRAMLEGVVEGAGNTDEQRGCYSYGRWILVKHGNGLTSIYSHLSGSLVQAGESVRTGQVIGYSGGMPGVFGSGYSTGPHLHVGLFASQGVSIRQFTQSRGCKQVVVPIVDIKAYLDPLAYLPQT